MQDIAIKPASSSAEHKSAEAQAYAQALQRDGYLVVRDVLDEAAVDRLAADVLAHCGPARYDRVLNGKPVLGERMKQAVDLAAKSPTLLDMLALPVFADLNAAVLLDHCGHAQLAAAMAMVVHHQPDAEPQILHRDEGNYPAFLPRIPNGPEYIYNVVIPCTDFRRENGATRIVPGSHLWPKEQWPSAADPVVPLEMDRGDIGVWLGSTYHGAGVNLTAVPRIGLIVSFCPGWLRPLENQFLQFDLETVAALPRQVQQYLGFDRHQLLGTWDWRAPLDCLDEIRAAQRARAAA